VSAVISSCAPVPHSIVQRAVRCHFDEGRIDIVFRSQVRGRPPPSSLDCGPETETSWGPRRVSKPGYGSSCGPSRIVRSTERDSGHHLAVGTDEGHHSGPGSNVLAEGTENGDAHLSSQSSFPRDLDEVRNRALSELGLELVIMIGMVASWYQETGASERLAWDLARCTLWTLILSQSTPSGRSLSPR